MSVDSKIERLIEEFSINPKALKTLALASGAGALGAGLDLYLSGHTDIKDFIKPMSAWGASGLAGGLVSMNKDDPKSTIKGKDIDEQYYTKV